jgi:branched-chain amino acid transport system ATP-binding protein
VAQGCFSGPMVASDFEGGNRQGREVAPVPVPPEPAIAAPANATTPSSKRLVVEDLTVEFGGLLALDGVSLSVAYGETVGVIGPNGAGKTTLFNVISGFVRARSGLVTYGGARLGTGRPHDLNKLGIARTLQGVGLCRGLTVAENVMLGAQARLKCDIGSAFLGLWRSSREERRTALAAAELLDRLGIGEYASRLPGTLPYGIQKRAALARSLMAEPSLLLLDEPASGLAEDEIDDLATLIRDLGRAMGVALVEHRIDLVTSVCDRIVVLNFGQVIADGSPAEIRADQDVATAYLGRDLEETASTSTPRAAAGA